MMMMVIRLINIISSSRSANLCLTDPYSKRSMQLPTDSKRVCRNAVRMQRRPRKPCLRRHGLLEIYLGLSVAVVAAGAAAAILPRFCRIPQIPVTTELSAI